MGNTKSYRLPTNVNPVNYEISLSPDLENFTFHGEESILVTVTEETKSISLNSVDISITQATLTAQNGTTQVPIETSFNEKYETVTFKFDKDVPSGEATLSNVFEGTLNDQLRGFYRSQYTNPEGEQKYLATTQFEATDARLSLIHI